MDGNVSSDYIDRHYKWFVFGFLFLALLWRGFNAFFDDTVYDGFAYVINSRNILEGHLATPYICKGILFHYNPLYPLMIAAGGIISGDPFVSGRAVNAILGALLVLLVFGFTRDVFGKRPAVYASALVVVHPLLSDLSSNVYSEPLFIILGLTGLWWSFRAWTRNSIWWAVAGGIMLGLAALTRTQAVALLVSALIGFLFIKIFLSSKAPRRWVAVPLLMVMAFAAFYVPYNLYVGQKSKGGEAGSKVAQEFCKKTSPFGEKSWFDIERGLTEKGDRLIWAKTAAEKGPAWMLKNHTTVYLKRVGRDLWRFSDHLFDNKSLPILLLLPFLLQLLRDGRDKEYRQGFGLFFLCVVVANLFALALVAVTVKRYIAFLLPMFIIVAGAGLDTLHYYLDEVLRRDKIPAWFFRAVPYILLFLSLVSYPHSGITDFDDDNYPPDNFSKRAAKWAGYFFDPSEKEIIMAVKPDIPALTGDYFYMLPLATPDKVAAYARAQNADYVIQNEWYLSKMTPDDRKLWVENDLEHFGLKKVGAKAFKKDRFYERKIVYKVTKKKEGVAKEQEKDPVAKLYKSLRERGSGSGKSPNIILISLDTLRADHLGCYGHYRNTSPFMDRLARYGTRFENVISQSPRTAPSHMTMFTGLYPSQHKVHFVYKKGKDPRIVSLDPNIKTLAALLKEKGYNTSGWTGGGQVAGEAGFDIGFDEYHEVMGSITEKKLFMVRDWIIENSDQPYFVFLHTYQIHDPYLPPDPYDEMYDPNYEGWIIGDRDKLTAVAEGKDFNSLHKAFWKKSGEDIDTSLFSDEDVEHLNGLYDGCIAYTDKVLEKFLADLAGYYLLKNTIVIITSDHGEEFMEHGGFLHKRLYRETLQVPLIIFAPGRVPADKTVSGRARLIDLPSTILELAGVKAPPQFLGKSLAGEIKGVENIYDLPAYSEDPWIYEDRSLRQNGYMLYDKGEQGKELYNLRKDPAERNNILPKDPDVLPEMKRKLGGFLTDFNKVIQTKKEKEGEGDELSEERTKSLRALGYIE